MAEPRGFRTYQPEQLIVLQRAFDRACAARSFTPDDDGRRELAVKLLDLFAGGDHDEERLFALALSATERPEGLRHAAA